MNIFTTADFDDLVNPYLPETAHVEIFTRQLNLTDAELRRVWREARWPYVITKCEVCGCCLVFVYEPGWMHPKPHSPVYCLDCHIDIIEGNGGI